MLTYLNYSKIESVTNNNVAHIHECVTHVKQSAEVRERYMTIGEMMDRSKAEGLAEGQQKGICKALLSILEELGGVSEELQTRIENADEATIIQWTKHAARAESLQEFLEEI